MTIETITDILHEYMYDRLYGSDNPTDGRDIRDVQEDGKKEKWSEKCPVTKNIKEDRSTKEKNTKTTGSDKAGHQTEPDNMHVHQEWSIVEITNRKDAMRNCAAYQEEFNT